MKRTRILTTWVAASMVSMLLLTGCSIEISNEEPTTTAEKKDDSKSGDKTSGKKTSEKKSDKSSERSTRSSEKDKKSESRSESRSGSGSEAGEHDGIYVVSFSKMIEDNQDDYQDEFSEDERIEIEEYLDSGLELYYFLKVDGEECEVAISETEQYGSPLEVQRCTIDYDSGEIDFRPSSPGRTMGTVDFKKDRVIMVDSVGSRLEMEKQS